MQRQLKPNERVRVYRNLHKGCFSVQGADGRVAGHVQTIVLRDVKFVVRPAGRKKVLETKRKNVHAFAVGVPISFLDHAPVIQTGKRVSYNPYKAPTFVDEDNNPVLTASIAQVDSQGIWVI